MKLALIEQRRVDLHGRAILETILVMARQHGLLLGFRQSPRREPQPGRRPGEKTAVAPPVPTGSRHCQRLAGWLHAHQRTELIDRGHHHFSACVIGCPNSLATFLNVDDDVRFLQVLLQALILAAQLFVFGGQWIALRLRTSFLRKGFVHRAIALLAPAISESAGLAAKGTAILASLTMFLLAALLRNYGRGKCLIDIGGRIARLLRATLELGRVALLIPLSLAVYLEPEFGSRNSHFTPELGLAIQQCGDLLIERSI